MIKTVIVNFDKYTDEQSYTTYDKIIDMLIKSQKLRLSHPNSDIICRMNIADSEIKHIVSSIYDDIIDSDLNINKKEYVELNMDEIGINDSEFDNEYEYNIIKDKLGPIMSNHFMFRERDLELRQKTEQKGGFNFRKNKIRFKHGYDPKISIVNKLYNINNTSIKNDQLKYFHTDKNHRFRPYYLKTMFDDVEPYEYLKPIINLTNYHSDNSYYQQLLNRVGDLSNVKHRLNLLDIDPKDRDSVMLNYVKCRKNVFSISLWNPAIQALDRFVELLEKEGEVYYVKTFNLTLKGLRNLMYWYYDEFSHQLSLEHIEKKLQYVDASETNSVCFILFDNVNNKQLSGQGAPFKKYLRNKLLEFTDLDTQKYRGNDLMHVNDYFYQTVEYSQIVLNDNTLKMLDVQDCRMYSNTDLTLSNLKFQTLRNVVYSNMSMLDIDRLIVLGGVVFYTFGVRAFNDIDTVLVDIQPNRSHELTNIVEHFFSDKSSKLFFLDGAIQGSKYWKDSWDEHDKPIFDFMDIKGYKDLILNPEHFFYFQGIKITIFEYEMIRKLIRNRTEDHIDFLMLNILYPEIIQDYVSLNSPYLSDKSNTIKPFEINDKYKQIVGVYNNRYSIQDKLKILKRRYSEDQIKKASENPYYTKYFNISD